MIIQHKLLLFAFCSFSSISFSQTISIGYPVDGAEPSSNAFFTIYLENGEINNTGAPITGWITKSGTTTPGVDYLLSNPFSIQEGDTATIMVVVVLDDDDEECDETIVATISDLSTGSIGVATSSLTIVDDECLTNSIVSVDATNSFLYPNPTTSNFTISSLQIITSVSIFDLTGRCLLQSSVNEKSFTQNLEQFESGSYFVIFSLNSGKSFTKKVIKR